MTAPTTSNVPYPAGAVHVCEWYDTDTPGRYFLGRSWPVERTNDGGGRRGGDMEVHIDGTQHVDGTVERFVWVQEGDYERITELTAAEARQLGQALIDAAAEVERMNSRDQDDCTTCQHWDSCPRHPKQVR